MSTLNTNQATTIIIACGIIALSALFPPRQYKGERWSSPGPTRTFIASPQIGVYDGPTGRGFVTIDTGKMIAERAIVIAVAGIFLVKLRQQ